jgi:hypothetical protein
MLILSTRFVVYRDENAAFAVPTEQLFILSALSYERLKEVVLVDVSTTMTATQLTLIWILVGCLLAWALFFAFLSLRPVPRSSEAEQPATKPHPLPATPAGLHMLATVPLSVGQVHTGQLQHEMNDSRAVPVRL